MHDDSIRATQLPCIGEPVFGDPHRDILAPGRYNAALKRGRPIDESVSMRKFFWRVPIEMALGVLHRRARGGTLEAPKWRSLVRRGLDS